MDEEILAIRGWVHDALKCAVEKRNEMQKVSDHDRGRIAGIISACQHVLVETSPSYILKKNRNAVNTWIADICFETPLSVSEVIEIYDFCDIKGMLSVDGIIETVKELGNVGFDSYGIEAFLELKAIRMGKRVNSIKWGRMKDNE